MLVFWMESAFSRDLHAPRGTPSTKPGSIRILQWPLASVLTASGASFSLGTRATECKGKSFYPDLRCIVSCKELWRSTSPAPWSDGSVSTPLSDLSEVTQHRKGKHASNPSLLGLYPLVFPKGHAVALNAFYFKYLRDLRPTK